MVAFVSGGGVNVSWKASSDQQGVKGHNVYRNGFFLASTSRTSFRDSQGRSGYRYYVIAYDRGTPVSFSPCSQEATAYNGISVRPADTVNSDRPSTPRIRNISGWYQQQSGEWSYGIQWPKSTDRQGIGGYNIYKNGRYWRTWNAAGIVLYRWDMKPGDTFYVTSFDNGTPRRYSTRSNTITIPPNNRD